MVPRAAMLATKIRPGTQLLLLLLAVLFLTACGPPGPRALLQGKELLDDGKTAAAIEKFKTATFLMPTNAAAWNYLGVAYHRSGQWTNAADSYSRALRFDRELLEVRYNLGTLWLEQNRLEDAKGELFSYTSRRPNDANGWVKLGAAQLRGRELTAAEKSFREALRVEGQNAEALNVLGLVQVQRNRPREAVESFTAALTQQPNYRPALLNLATVLHQQLDDRAEALKRYRQYLALQPRPADWDAVNAIVQSLESAAPVAGGAPTTAPPVAPTVASRPSPPARPVQTNFSKPATIVAAAANPVTAPKPVVTNPPANPPANRVVEKSPTPSPIETVKLPPDPVIKTAVQDLPPARPANPPPATPAPTSKEPQVASAVRTSAPTRVATAKAAPGRYAYQSPKVPVAGDRQAAQQALAQGQTEQRARRTAEALQFYRRATQLDGSYFEAYYLLGLAAYELRSFNTAAGAWEMAIVLRPEAADARYNFALTLKAAGHPQDAADELEKLLALHPDEARGHLTLGNLYAEQLKDIPRARKHYQRVLQLDPRNPQAQAIRYWLVANPG